MKVEVIEKLTVLITSAFGLVAALAWNDTVKAIFTKLFEAPNTIPAMLIYSMLITIVAVVITIVMGRAANKAKRHLRKKKK